MFGSRVNTLVDGLNVSPACPNWMDPPLSFVPTSDLHEVVVDRGISPVSTGGESIGGTIRATTRQGRSSTGEEFAPHGVIGIGGQSVDSGYNGNALLWLSNDRRRLYFTPRVCHKRVDDYIQRTPLASGPAAAFRRTAANMVRGLGFCQANPAGPTCVPLQFTNVDAEFYGIDAGFGVAITGRWRVDGINRVIADPHGNPIDLDVGERLPGRGRSFFIRAEYFF